MGIMQYVLPIGMFAVSIKIACDGTEELSSKLIQYGIAIICLSVVFSVFQISSGELQSSKEISEIVKDAYSFGEQGKGGGAIRSSCCCATCKTSRRYRCSYILHRFVCYITCIYIWNKFIRYN